MIPPNNTALGIDHALVTVHDHDQVIVNYRRLGFAPSPASYHPWGTVTSLVVLQNNFIELIAVADSSKFGTNATNGFCFGRYLGRFLDREEGVSLVALHSKDARADHAAVTARGIHSQGFIDFRRFMTKSDGSPDTVVVSLALLIDEALGDASHFICHQHRPELIWMPAWQNHPNGVTDIVAVTYVADPPSMLKARFSGLYGSDKIQDQEDGFVVDTGCGEFRILSNVVAQRLYSDVPWPEQNADRPHVVALTLHARDLKQVETLWREASVPYVRSGRRLLAAPNFCGNVILEFVST